MDPELYPQDVSDHHSEISLTSPKQESSGPKYFSRLQRLLATHFNEEELRTLCLDLSVHYDDLPAQGNTNKARELVTYLERRGRIPELVAVCSELRPRVSWQDPSLSYTDPSLVPENVPLDQSHAEQVSVRGEAKSHSFIFRQPVRPDNFLDRQNELRAIFNRLRKGESTAIVGEPHIGKSSLLLKLADKATQRVYLGDDAQRLVVSCLDLQHIGNDYTPTVFWEKVLKPLLEHPGHPATAQRVKQIAQASYAGDSWEELFDHLYKQERRLVLLLDRFERLLFLSSFRDSAFFAQLRKFDSFPSFSFIAASRLSLKRNG